MLYDLFLVAPQKNAQKVLAKLFSVMSLNIGYIFAMKSCHEKTDHEHSFVVANTGTVSKCLYANYNFIRTCPFFYNDNEKGL